MNGVSFPGAGAATPTPTITSLSPTHGVGAGGTALTITGTGFQAGCTVTVGGVAATSVVRVSATSVTCVTPAEAGVFGPDDVVVTNPDGRGSTSKNFGFDAPTVTAITPSSGPLAGATSITDLHGTGFVTGCTVSIGGAPATSVAFVSSVKLTCTTPAHAATGAVDVVVTNPDTQAGTGAALFTYAPTISAISPASGLHTAATPITITGTGFNASPTVTVGGVAATSVVRVSSTSITCTTPTGTVGAADVVVTNTDSSTVTSTGGFTYILDPATLTLSSWFRGYSGAPWNGTASAGTSSVPVMNLPDTEAPPTGTAVNGFTPAAFDGTDDCLRDPSRDGSSYFAAAAYSIVTMVKPHAGAAPDANAYVDQQLFCVGGDEVGISWSTSGVRAWHYDGTNWNATSWIACSADAWHMVACTFNGTTLSLQVDNGTAQTVARNSVGALSGVPKLGRARNAGAYISMQTMELMTAKSALSAGNLTGLNGYFKYRYPSAALP